MTLAAFTDEVCKCTDNDCIERVSDARNKYTHDLSARGAEAAIENDPQRLARGVEQQELFLECARRIIKRDPGHIGVSKKKLLRHVELRDEMCRCTDKQCAGRVGAAVKQHVAESRHVPLLNDEDEARILKLMIEGLACSLKVDSKE